MDCIGEVLVNDFESTPNLIKQQIFSRELPSAGSQCCGNIAEITFMLQKGNHLFCSKSNTDSIIILLMS
jgi:hypothetical protein